jgi:hypothetical protein
VTQFDLFPIIPLVEKLDPKRVVGAKTAVLDLVRVRFRPSEPPHLVFHDRHGWYCEAHGVNCIAVRVAQGKES